MLSSEHIFNPNVCCDAGYFDDNTVVGALDTQVVSYPINNFIRKFVGGVEFKYMF